jgi:hypothetical protein
MPSTTGLLRLRPDGTLVNVGSGLERPYGVAVEGSGTVLVTELDQPRGAVTVFARKRSGVSRPVAGSRRPSVAVVESASATQPRPWRPAPWPRRRSYGGRNVARPDGTEPS